MSLRVRLVVAFFLLSVVPLAAMTFYTYTTNATAIRDAAGREAQSLAGELTAGDMLFFYTDGCVEAENASGEMFGATRLEHLLTQPAFGAGEDALVRVEREITSFRSGREPFDDATMMVVKVG